MTRFLIGLDDTDNLESRGTGHRARQLAQTLEAAGHATIEGITRHQLLVDPRIPYTSHNSSACLLAEFQAEAFAPVTALARDFLLRESAPGSDVGLCIAAWASATPAIQAFGQRAKAEILTQADAVTLAERSGLYLEGLTGTKGGIIGALAAVGLRAAGNDGRVLWLRGLRELSGIYSAEELCSLIKIDTIETEAGLRVPPEAQVQVSDWARPLVRGGRVVLLVQEADHVEYDWCVAPKERIKQLTN